MPVTEGIGKNLGFVPEGCRALHVCMLVPKFLATEGCMVMRQAQSPHSNELVQHWIHYHARKVQAANTEPQKQCAHPALGPIALTRDVRSDTRQCCKRLGTR